MKKFIGVILILILVTILVHYFKKSPKIENTNIDESKSEETVEMSNIIEDVEYSSKD